MRAWRACILAHVLADLPLEERDTLRAQNLGRELIEQHALGELPSDADPVRARGVTAVDVTRGTVLSGIDPSERAAALLAESSPTAGVAAAGRCA